MEYRPAHGVVLRAARLLRHGKAMRERVERLLKFALVEQLLGFGEEIPLELLQRVLVDVRPDLGVVPRHVPVERCRHRRDAQLIFRSENGVGGEAVICAMGKSMRSGGGRWHGGGASREWSPRMWLHRPRSPSSPRIRQWGGGVEQTSDDVVGRKNSRRCSFRHTRTPGQL